MKKDYLLKIKLSIILLGSSLTADQGSISGKVTGEGSYLVGANVFLKGTSLGSVTDSVGNYFIVNVPIGKYQVRVDYIGYESEEREVYISSGELDIADDAIESSSFTSKLGIDDLDDEEQVSLEKSNNLFDINFDLKSQVLEVSQVVVSASRREEKIIDAVANITAVSESKIRRSGGGDFGMVLKTAKGVDVYQAGMGRTNINAR